MWLLLTVATVLIYSGVVLLRGSDDPLNPLGMGDRDHASSLGKTLIAIAVLLIVAVIYLNAPETPVRRIDF